jgi:hypothetical protein
MNLPFLTQLQITTEDRIDSHTWVKTFGCVQGYAPHYFLEALVYKTKAAEKSKIAYRNVSFPKLRYIHLESTDFFELFVSVDMLLDCLMEVKQTQWCRCFVWMTTISSLVTSKGLKKLLSMLSGMELEESEEDGDYHFRKPLEL